MPKQPSLYSYPTTDILAQHLRTYILSAEAAALQRHSTFKIAVSGGSLPATLSKALLNKTPNENPSTSPQFSKWEIFFADERAVPLDHEDSNYMLVKRDLLDRIPSSEGTPKVYPINISHLSNTQDLADDYQETLTNSFASKDSVKLPMFDLILLGCGPDGHTCSLFPGHALLRESDAWVASIDDSPKPPPRRITLTLPVVTHALRIAFVATGAGKKDVLKRIFEGGEDGEGRSLPCGLVNEQAGEKVSWFCDDAAVEGVSFPRRGSL
jgi:6-phosphogluconolactonase